LSCAHHNARFLWFIVFPVRLPSRHCSGLLAEPALRRLRRHSRPGNFAKKVASVSLLTNLVGTFRHCVDIRPLFRLDSSRPRASGCVQKRPAISAHYLIPAITRNRTRIAPSVRPWMLAPIARHLSTLCRPSRAWMRPITRRRFPYLAVLYGASGRAGQSPVRARSQVSRIHAAISRRLFIAASGWPPAPLTVSENPLPLCGVRKRHRAAVPL